MLFRRHKEEGKETEEGKEELQKLPSAPGELPPLPKKFERKEDFAPLFVKVEKYREIVGALQEIRGFVANIKKLFGVVSELETARGEAIRLMRVAVERFDRAVVDIDQALLRPIGFEEFPKGEMEIKHVEKSLSDLHRQIEGLRKEVEEFK